MKSNSLDIESLIIAREGAALSAPISLTLKGGDLLAVHGSNGSGKSTLLKTLAGLLPIYRGRITHNTEWPSTQKPLYLGHKRGLTPSMSVVDNVSFWAKAAGFAGLTAAAMRYFDLEDAAHATVAELSAGWQQRVALTRLITMPSNLWLLDEPTANLDREGMALLQSLLQSRAEQGGIIIIASHMHMQGANIALLHLDKALLQDEVAS
ncbi:MAG: heme ABC exporter ATP-binding protein CcmA [Rickettsiales bacterium]|nr:heme ABC exporter ATP-binding protein CcmA [Rickettsiales bacterium]